jgi:hypothetical protein
MDVFGYGGLKSAEVRGFIHMYTRVGVGLKATSAWRVTRKPEADLGVDCFGYGVCGDGLLCQFKVQRDRLKSLQPKPFSRIGNLLMARSGHSLSTCTCGRRARRLNGSRADFAVEFDCVGPFRPPRHAPRPLTWSYIR